GGRAAAACPLPRPYASVSPGSCHRPSSLHFPSPGNPVLCGSPSYPCRTPLARCVRLRVHTGRSRMSGSHAMSGGGMVYAIVAQVLSLLVDLLSGGQRSEQAKELEILVLRQQLRVLQRTQAHPPQPSRWEKLALAVLT